MTVKELRELLADAPDTAEVRIASQPSYPFQNSVAAVIGGTHIIDAAPMSEDDAVEDDPDHDYSGLLSDFNGTVDPESVVYIVEGSQLGYMTKLVFGMAEAYS
jgi:hypothetical protein